MHMSNLLIFWCRWLCLISISSEKFEFYKYKMYLDVEIVDLIMLLHNSKFNNFSEYCVRCHFFILSWFHNYNFICIWWQSLISVLCRNVTLMITDSQKCKWKNEDRGNRVKKEEKIEYEIGFLSFVRFIAFTILVTFKNFVIRP